MHVLRNPQVNALTAIDPLGQNGFVTDTVLVYPNAFGSV